MIGLLMLAEATVGHMFLNGNALLARCDQNREACEMYVAGNFDQLQLTTAAMGRIAICPSKDVTMAQATDVVLKYLADHPDSRDKVAPFLVSMALVQAFPCTKRRCVKGING